MPGVLGSVTWSRVRGRGGRGGDEIQSDWEALSCTWSLLPAGR